MTRPSATTLARSAPTAVAGAAVLGLMATISGCQLIVSFDRSRIADDAGIDAGPPFDAGPVDAGPVDAALLDAGPDAGPMDAPMDDAGATDAGAMDAPMDDAGATDAPMDDAGPPDAPPDLDAPAAPDAPPLPDAGPCATTCGGSTPICDPSDGTCVECLAVGDCTGAGGCVARQCVDCDADDDCPLATAAACNTTTNVCEACAADADCAHLTSTPVCDEGGGRCVACTADTEAARCGGNACILGTGACSSTPVGSLGACDVCPADSACPTGARCVSIGFGTTAASARCLFEAAGGCGDTVAARRPYTAMTSGTSLGGVAGPFCAPPAGTSCEGVLDLVADQACATDADCGLPAEADGACLPATTCSYACALDVDCPSGISCGATTMVCDGL